MVETETETEKVTKPEKSQAQISCEAKGGKWDEASQTCSVGLIEELKGKGVIPEDKIPKEWYLRPEAFPLPPEGLKGGFNASRGGFVSEDGQFFPTSNQDFVPPAEVDQVNKFNEDGTITVTRGGITETLTAEEFRVFKDVPGSLGGNLTRKVASLQQGQSLAEQRRSQIASGLGQIDPSVLEGAGQGDVDYLTALASGVPGIMPDLAAGFAAGAVAGATVGGVAGAAAGAAGGAGVGALPGAAVGAKAGAIGLGSILAAANAARGFYGDFLSDIKRQKGDYVQSSITELSERKGALGAIVGAVNGGADPAEGQRQFNNQLSLIERDKQELTAESNSFLNKFLGQNTIDELKEYNAFYSEGGEREMFITEMFLATQNPDPSKISLTTEQEESLKAVIRKSLLGVGQ